MKETSPYEPVTYEKGLSRLNDLVERELSYKSRAAYAIDAMSDLASKATSVLGTKGIEATTLGDDRLKEQRDKDIDFIIEAMLCAPSPETNSINIKLIQISNIDCKKEFRPEINRLFNLISDQLDRLPPPFQLESLQAENDFILIGRY